MTKAELNTKIEELRELEELLNEVKAEVESIKDELKTELVEHNLEELDTERFIIRLTPVTSNRFNSTLFKKEHNELYKAYLKQTTSKRFSISA